MLCARIVVASTAVFIAVTVGGGAQPRSGESDRAASSQSVGGSGQWRSLGPADWNHSAATLARFPNHGTVLSVAVAARRPNVVFAGTRTAGIWMSVDTGAHWVEVATDLNVTFVPDIAICAEKPNVVYAVTDRGTVKSTDGGSTWSPAGNLGAGDDNGLYSIRRIAVAASNPDVAYMVSGNNVYRTVNGGGIWFRLYVIPPEVLQYTDVQVHPRNSSVVYLAAIDNEYGFGAWSVVQRSTDGGRTFSTKGAGYPRFSSGNFMKRAMLAITPYAASDVRVICAGGAYDGVEGVFGEYLSHDAAESFTSICCGETDGPEPADPARGNPNLFGETDTSTGTPLISTNMGYAVSDVDPRYVVAGGVHPWYSTDGGRTWGAANGIFRGVRRMVYAGGVVWMATDGGVVRSLDNGRTYEDRGAGISAVSIVGITQSLSRDVIAVSAAGGGVYVRDLQTYGPAGGGWYPLIDSTTRNATLNPVDDRWLYCGASSRDVLFRERDIARRPIPSPLGITIGGPAFDAVAFDPRDYTTLITTDREHRRIVRSTDNGVSWRTLKTFTDSVELVKQSNAKANLLVAMGDRELWNSVDGGTTWKRLIRVDEITAGKPLLDIALSDQDQFRMWGIVGGGHGPRSVVTTTDGGGTWMDYSGSLATFDARSLVAQRGTDGGVFVGTTQGVYYRNDAMKNWQPVGAGLPVCTVNALAINYAGRTLRAGTTRGLWECDLPESSRPRAVIACDRTVIACPSDAVRFGSYSLASGSSTTISWTFPGGDPATSAEPNPTVHYARPGSYGATLTVTDQFGTDAQTLDDLIHVYPGECGLDSTAGLAVRLGGAERGFIELPRVDVPSNAFTFMAWIRPEGIQPDSSALLASDAGLFFGFRNGSNELAFEWKGEGGGWKSGLLVPPDAWSHVALVCDGSGVTVYLNGNPAHLPIVIQGIELSAPGARLGENRIDGESRGFVGLIDEVCLYGRPLSREEVRGDMHLLKTAASAGLRLYYQFNEAHQTAPYDRVGSLHAIAAAGVKRVPSRAPIGPGTSYRTYVAGPGDRNFEGTGVEMQFVPNASYVNGDIIVYRLRARPDRLPEDSARLSNTYWIVRSWGSNIFTPPGTMKFNGLGMISRADASAPGAFKLYRRDVNADVVSWGPPVDSAVMADAANGGVTFSDAGDALAFGQFIVGTSGTSLLAVSERDADRAFALHPNPAADVASVTAARDEAGGTVELVDLLGRTHARSVLREAVGSAIARLDLSGVPTGIYLVRVGAACLRLVRR